MIESAKNVTGKLHNLLYWIIYEFIFTWLDANSNNLRSGYVFTDIYTQTAAKVSFIPLETRYKPAILLAIIEAN